MRLTCRLAEKRNEETSGEDDENRGVHGYWSCLSAVLFIQVKLSEI